MDQDKEEIRFLMNVDPADAARLHVEDRIPVQHDEEIDSPEEWLEEKLTGVVAEELARSEAPSQE